MVGGCGHLRGVRDVHEAAAPLFALGGQQVHQAVEDVVAHERPGGLGDLGLQPGLLVHLRDTAFDREGGEVGGGSVGDDVLVDGLAAGVVGDGAVVDVDGDALDRDAVAGERPSDTTSAGSVSSTAWRSTCSDLPKTQGSWTAVTSMPSGGLSWRSWAAAQEGL
ncbi:hypothetical protein GCM10020295_01400 [Streptomyces cinereospinus]